MNDKIRVLSFEDGKYELRLCGHILTGWRYNEPWQDFTGNKLMYLIFVRMWNFGHPEDLI